MTLRLLKILYCTFISTWSLLVLQASLSESKNHLLAWIYYYYFFLNCILWESWCTPLVSTRCLLNVFLANKNNPFLRCAHVLNATMNIQHSVQHSNCLPFIWTSIQPNVIISRRIDSHHDFYSDDSCLLKVLHPRHNLNIICPFSLAKMMRETCFLHSAFLHHPKGFRETPYGCCSSFGTWARDGRYNTIHIFSLIL